MRIKRIITIVLIILLCTALCVPSLAANDTRVAEYKSEQSKLHEAADMLRELGYTDDSDIIRELSAKWHAAQSNIDFFQSMEYIGRYYVTGYTAGAVRSVNDPLYGITASGKYVTPWYTVAMHCSTDFGTRIYIDGLESIAPDGQAVYEVQDRGVGTGVIDVCCETIAECYSVTGLFDAYEVLG